MKQYVIMIDGSVGLNGTQLRTTEVVELLNENVVLKDKIQRAKNYLVCCPITDPVEVCENTLEILDS